MARAPCVYILASRRNGTLYIGATTDLARRVADHKARVREGFTSRYDVDRLVHVEEFDRINDAFERERRLKRWRRAWKIALIEETNPDWRDLYDDILK